VAFPGFFKADGGGAVLDDIKSIIFFNQMDETLNFTRV
jgi:hypothetical protein